MLDSAEALVESGSPKRESLTSQHSRILALQMSALGTFLPAIIK